MSSMARNILVCASFCISALVPCIWRARSREPPGRAPPPGRTGSRAARALSRRCSNTVIVSEYERGAEPWAREAEGRWLLLHPPVTPDRRPARPPVVVFRLGRVQGAKGPGLIYMLVRSLSRRSRPPPPPEPRPRAALRGRLAPARHAHVRHAARRAGPGRASRFLGPCADAPAPAGKR